MENDQRTLVCANCNQQKNSYASTEFLDGAFICEDCYISLCVTKEHKGFYNEYECLNEEGNKINKEVEEFLKPLYEKYKYTLSVRDLTHIIFSAAHCLECETIVRRNLEIRKRERENNGKE